MGVVAQLRRMMRDRSGLRALALVCAVAATRYLFRSHYLYDIDSVNFGLALGRFDPSVFQPHPPGYFLYICLGRLAGMILRDPNAALVAISIAASCGAAWMIYLITEAWHGRGAAGVSAVLFVVSPLCWFHGTVALTYIVEAFFSALVGYLCWKVYTGEARVAVPAAVALAAAAGFRPSTVLFLGPLWIASVWRAPRRHRWLALAALVTAALAWFIPMILASGGVAAYFGSLAHLWRLVPGRRTTLADPALAVARIFTIAWIFVLCFGAASALLFWRGTGAHAAPGRSKFIWVWVGPGLLFFAFVFLNYVNSGYLLVLCPPMFALLAGRGYEWLTMSRKQWARWAAAAGLTANCAFFAFAPVYCSHQGVRVFERAMRTISRDFSEGLDPKTTLIVGFDSHFLGYRHAGYYLPAFVTVQYPEVQYPDGKRVFVLHGRNTQLLRRLPTEGFEQFVFFPLPAGGEYSAYLEKIRKQLPEGTLRIANIGGQKLLTGPMSAMPLLFPSAAGAAEALYTTLHQAR